ncbi:MAG: TRAP transporter substrate-binding protein DctP [Thermodesulfobacteriota bacterium]|nr:TRAP transporter substrate-binding protein DctP [Thermodesulfobacteriota bacterium]
MRLRIFFISIFFLSGLFFLAVGLSEADTKKKRTLWKMATHAPQGISYALYIEDYVDPLLIKVTEGNVAFDWYYGGIMGDDEDWLAKIRIGQLHGAGFDGHGTKLFCPPMAVFDLPFLFKNSDEVAYVKNKMRSKIIKGFKDTGFVLLVLIDQGNEGFDEIYSIKRPIRSPQDFAKTKFVTYSGVVEAEILKALGSSPIPLNVPEIVSSIRSGVCDGLIAPAIWYVGAQLYTITKYVTPVRLRYAPGGLAVSLDAWNKIPERYHKPVKESLLGIEDRVNKDGWDSSKKCYKAMIKYGLKEVKLTPDEVQTLKKKTRPVWSKLAGKEFPRELLDEVIGYLDEYRSMEGKR